MIDPGIDTAITAAIEKVINAALAFDPASKQALSKLTDPLAITTTTPPLTIYLKGSENGLRVMVHCEEPEITRLKGSPLALLNLLKQPTSLADSGVDLDGRVQTLQKWQDFISNLDIDWEDAISQILGDIAGPLTANGIRSGLSWVKQQQQSNETLLKNYLTEELKLTPTKTELENFFQQVQNLSQDTDRLEARIEKIKSLRKKDKNPS
jgi:ubiquinone biosynthesis protein UbiJ